MKTAMDVKIRQKGLRQLQYRNLRMRRRRRFVSGAFELREEVLEELPETYRKTFRSLTPGQREQILASIERKVDRKFSAGTLSEASMMSDGIEKGKLKTTVPGTGRAAKREAIAKKYRLSQRASKAGRSGYPEYPEVISSLSEGRTIDRAPEEAVLKDRIQQQQIQKKQLRQIQFQRQQLQPGQRSTYMRQAEGQSPNAISGAFLEEKPGLSEDSVGESADRWDSTAEHAPYMRGRQKEADIYVKSKVQAMAKARAEGQIRAEQIRAEQIREASLQVQRKKAVSGSEAEARTAAKTQAEARAYRRGMGLERKEDAENLMPESVLRQETDAAPAGSSALPCVSQ